MGLCLKQFSRHENLAAAHPARFFQSEQAMTNDTSASSQQTVMKEDGSVGSLLTESMNANQ